jgi:hypothetical protein
VWTRRLNRERARWLGLVALALAAGGLIAAAPVASASVTTRTDRETSRGNAPRSDAPTPNGRRVFGGSVAPVVGAPGFAPAPAAPAATWSVVSPGRSPSIMPVAGDGVAMSRSNADTSLTLGVLLLGAGVLTLLGGLAAATLHGQVYVG